MNESASFFEFVVLGTVAIVVVMMLRNALGRKVGNEEDRARPQDQKPAQETRTRESDGQAPMAPVPAPQYKPEPISIDEFAEPGSKLAQSLTEIQVQDSQFDPGVFLSGAKAAYEMIVNGFARDDKKALRPLLAEDVYKNFSSVIDQRKSRGEKVETTFIGINNSEISAAALTSRVAEISVKFVSELISATKNSDGAIIDGDPNQIFKVTDIWTFSRDIKSNDPNWKVSATASGA
jgi:predicted lipid-binding transport protein (Tim44 family)